MSRSDWYISDEAGRALVALAGGAEVDPDLLTRPEMSRLCYRHGLVLPAVRALGTDRSRGLYLAAVAARLAARHTCIDQHLRRILTRLAERDLRAAVVKGPAVKRLYRDPSVRTYTDVDLVVPDEELPAALETLATYEHIGAIPAKVPAADKRDIVVRDPSGVQFSVDLHWDLFSFSQLDGSADTAMEWAWEEAKFDADHPLGPLWHLPDETVTSFLGLHALLDHRFRLILFRDLLEVAHGGPDWDRLEAFARDHGIASLQYLSWLIAVRTVGAAVPDSYLDRLRRRSWPEEIAERYLARVDLVRFNGHRVHPLNLSITQVHDEKAHRRRLLLRAPLAYPGWRKRVQPGTASDVGSVDILVTSDARRGAEVFGQVLTDQLVLRGWDAALVSLRGGSTPRVSSVPLEGPVPLKGLRWSVLAALRRRFRMYEPSVVFANGGATLRYAVFASLFLKNRPRLVYGSIGEPSFWLRGSLHSMLQRLLLARCDHVTAVSAATARGLQSPLAVPEKKISMIHLGVDDSWFRLTDRMDDPGPLRVLFAGKLSYEKDPLTAVEAVERLGGAALLRIVGEGPLREQVEDIAGPHIELVGAVDDMKSQMDWADVLLLTSLTEGLPGVVVEASAAGLPVVASDVGGTGEIVDQGETGLLVEPGDADGFVAALRTLAEDPELRVKLGVAARERAWERFRLSDTVDAYESAFRRVAAR